MGEFALIERMNAGREQGTGIILGPGDDAAIVAAPAGRYVVSTDMLVQDRHFRLDWSTPTDIGRKAIAQNAADVVAMGAAPSAFVVSLGCPSETPVEFVDRFVDGLWSEADRAGGSIAGGDLVRSPVMVISVTAFGDPPDRPVLRTGARPGDVVAVAGKLGWSAAGLALLTAVPDAAAFPDVVAAHRVPQPEYSTVLTLPADVAITAMIDVSDGLLADLGHIAESSGVAIDLDSEAVADPALVPVAEALNVGAPGPRSPGPRSPGAEVLGWTLTGGEDHAFAATFAAGQRLPAGWSAIGRVDAGAGVTVDGVSRTGSSGWESFAGGG